MTNKSIDVSRLVTELRKRFGSAKNLCRVLGVDENLLRPDKLALDARGNRFGRDEGMPNGGSPTVSAARSLRAAIEQALAGYEDLPEGLTKALLEAAEKHAPMDAGDNGEVDRGAEAEELRRRERRGAEALDCESAAEFLRSKGVDEETIKSAVGMVKDAFPPNALPNGGALGRGAGPGAKFAAKRAAGAADARLDRKFGLDRIEAWGAADHAIDRRPVLSRTGMDKLSKKFPGIESVIV